MSSAWFEPERIDGADIRLEPLSPAHAAGLWRTSHHDDVWRWMPVRRPATVAEMGAVVAAALADPDRVAWAIVSRADGAAVGSTSYLDIVPAHRRLEVGWTWLGPQWWRTAVNSQVKLLLLGRAFDVLGATRVALKTDAANLRSQAAIERLGGVREGTLRAHMVRPDGSPRDTVYYSVLASEWPAVRARLGG